MGLDDQAVQELLVSSPSFQLRSPIAGDGFDQIKGVWKPYGVWNERLFLNAGPAVRGRLHRASLHASY